MTTKQFIRDSQSLRSFIAERQNEVATTHKNGASGFSTCIFLTGIMDEAIMNAVSSLNRDMVRFGEAHVAVLAMGGYGRKELCPKSDVDVMILYDAAAAKNTAEEYAKALLHFLWDAGLDLGHSVRTLDEAVSLHGSSLDAWVSMLESRHLCGSPSLSARLFDVLRERSASDAWIRNGILADTTARHERYGNSVKLLEPDVKKSAGGLRDIHAAFWFYRTKNTNTIGYSLEKPATVVFIDQLVQDGLLLPDGGASARSALEFLLRTRHEMHFLRQSSQNTLEYNLQREVAQGLGFGPKAELNSVEVFMRQYYLHAHVLSRLHRRVLREFEGSARKQEEGITVAEALIARDDLLYSTVPIVNAQQIFQAFMVGAENDLEFSPLLETEVERAVVLITDEVRTSPEVAKMFGRILRSRRVAETLRSMNDLGVLGAYVPEFGDLVAFFQHNVYHFFTADEHTLLAIAAVEKLREQPGVLHEVFRGLRRKDILYLAILLHDIAKPRGVTDHEITGVLMAEVILTRFGMEDAIPDVAFLVRNHLVMEQIAFRRNIHDPATIREFASLFETPEQLDCLYLLTFADLSAVNMSVWTEWKGLLLQDLYRATKEVLVRNISGTAIDAHHQQKHQAVIESLIDALAPSIPRADVERHLRGIGNDSYAGVFSKEEMEQHIRLANEPATASTLVEHQDGYSELTVITRDAPFALSRICAVLAANDANIFDANIFTREDGVIIDIFSVADVRSGGRLSGETCTKISSDLSPVLEGTLDVEHLFAAHRRKWKRRKKLPPNPNIRQDVEFEETERYTIIDVYTSDSLGLLYRITETISRLGIDIFFAKIATRVDGIVDAFYTRERTGETRYNEERKRVIRAELLKTIRKIAGQELE